jgi:2'-5' RNA ligase
MFDPKSPDTTGYHIFVEPQGELRDKMQSIINSLASSYRGPVFTPHVTLLPRISGYSEEQVIEKTQELARSMSPHTVSLGALAGDPAFFRALYSEVSNPSELNQYHEIANQLFGLADVNEYKPHLSLFYGNISDETRAQMIEIIEYDVGESFEVNILHVYHTPGAAETWKKIAEVDFS